MQDRKAVSRRPGWLREDRQDRGIRIHSRGGQEHQFEFDYTEQSHIRFDR